MNGADIDIIFFDAGGTLLYPDPPVGQVYARAGRRIGIEADSVEMERVFWRTFKEMPSGMAAQSPKWWREMIRRVFSRFGKLRDPDALHVELEAWFSNAKAFRQRSCALTIREAASYTQAVGRTGYLAGSALSRRPADHTTISRIRSMISADQLSNDSRSALTRRESCSAETHSPSS